MKLAGYAESVVGEAHDWSRTAEHVQYSQRCRAGNILESYHASVRRIQVRHPNLFTFLAHLERVTTDRMHDLSHGLKLNIRRAKKKTNPQNEARMKGLLCSL